MSDIQLEPIKVWIPDSVGLGLLGQLPLTVSVEVFDERNGHPPSSDVVFWVLPARPSMSQVELIGRLPSLQVLQLVTAGYDDIVSHVPPGVTLCSAAGVHDGAVSEWILSVTLAILRRIPDYQRLQARGAIERTTTDSLVGKTVLILGYGSIGKAVERLMQPFDVNFIKVALHARPDVHPVRELPDLLPAAQILIILTPLTDLTSGMISADLMRRLPDNAVIVNAARGKIIEQDALLAELRTGRLYAALDATDPDPLPTGHALLSEPGLLYTPHVAAWTRLRHVNEYRFVAQQIHRFAAGQPLLNQVATGTAQPG
jgi:phosphoglycerate dehydrogenase-like enzyme